MADQRIANNSVDSAPESGVVNRDAHTAGPWKVIDGHVYAERFIRDTTVVVDGESKPHREGLIALVYAPVDPERVGQWSETDAANSRLIASAPDLLALLDDVRDFVDNYIDVNDGDDGQPRPNAAMQLDSEIQRVLAKARGERWPS